MNYCPVQSTRQECQRDCICHFQGQYSHGCSIPEGVLKAPKTACMHDGDLACVPRSPASNARDICCSNLFKPRIISILINGFPQSYPAR